MKLVLSICLLLACAAGTGCRSNSVYPPAEPNAKSQAEISAAALLPKDDPHSQSLERGMRMALEQVNADGGVGGKPFVIRFCHYDPNDDPRGERALQQVLKSNPDLLWLGGQAAVWQAPELIGKNLTVCFLTDYPPVPSLLDHASRIYFNGPQQAKLIYDALHSSDIATVALLHCAEPQTRALDDYLAFLLKGDGIRIYQDAFSPNETAFAPLAEQLARLQLDAVCLVGPAPECERLTLALEKSGYKGVLLGLGQTDALDNPRNFPAIERRMIRPLPERGLRAGFCSAWSQRFGAPPNALEAYGYENVCRLAQALNAAATLHPEEIARKLTQNTAAYAWEALAFEPDGDTAIPLKLHTPPTAVPISPAATASKKQAEPQNPALFLLDPPADLRNNSPKDAQAGSPSTH